MRTIPIYRYEVRKLEAGQGFVVYDCLEEKQLPTTYLSRYAAKQAASVNQEQIGLEKLPPKPQPRMDERQLLHKWFGGMAGIFADRIGRENLVEIAETIERRRGDRKCRRCGCTDNDCSQCVAKTGSPCSWLEFNLCSACT